MITGLPILPATPTRREWTLWFNVAVERIRREAVTQAMSGDQQRGRVEGAERLRDLLLSSLPPQSE